MLSSHGAMAQDPAFAKPLGLLALFGLHEDDETWLAGVREIAAPRIEEVVSQFYAHLQRFPETRAFLGEPGRVAALQRTLGTYILSLGKFSWHEPASVVAYCSNRVQIGMTHRRIGLEPRLYFGAYSKLGELLTEVVTAAGAVDSLPSLHKILLFDCHLAIEAYERESHDALVELASVDELTKMLTRKALVVELSSEIARARRFGRPLTLAFLDVDRFKQINDTLGHAFGDRVLRDIAEILHTSIRPMDIAGRYGGDEFVIAIVEATEAAARPVAERVHRRMATLMGSDVTLSIGLAALRAGDNLDSLLARADAAMYRAKAIGPGQIAVSGAG